MLLAVLVYPRNERREFGVAGPRLFAAGVQVRIEVPVPNEPSVLSGVAVVYDPPVNVAAFSKAIVV